MQYEEFYIEMMLAGHYRVNDPSSHYLVIWRLLIATDEA